MVRAAGAVCGKFYAFFTAKNRQTVGAGTAPLGVGLDTVGWELPVYQAGVQQPLLVVVESRCVGPVLVGLRFGDQNPRQLARGQILPLFVCRDDPVDWTPASTTCKPPQPRPTTGRLLLVSVPADWRV